MLWVCLAIGLVYSNFGKCKVDLAELVGFFVIMVVNEGKFCNDVFGNTVVGAAKLRKTCIVIPQLGIDVAEKNNRILR